MIHSSHSYIKLPLFFFLSLILLMGICHLLDSLSLKMVESPLLDVWLRIFLFIFLFLLFLSYRLISNISVKCNVSVGLLSIFLTLCLYLVLQKTPYDLNGIGGDQAFRTAYLTKLAHTFGWGDFFYKDLPAFYPPLYFWILARFSNLFHIAPFMMLKWGSLSVVFLLPFLTKIFWNLITDEKKATLMAFSCLVWQYWYAPYEWLSLILFIPWWIYFMEGAGKSRQNRNKIINLLLGGALGGIIFQTYYYWFFIGGVSLLVGFAINRVFTQEEGLSSRKFDAGNKIIMLGSVSFFSFPYWGPFLFNLFSHRGGDILQNRYFDQYMVTLPLPFMELSLKGMVFLLSIVYLIMSFQKDKVSRSIIVLIASAYVWFLLGYISVLLDRPLLHIKAESFIDYALSLSLIWAFSGLIQIEKVNTWITHRGKKVFLVLCILLLLYIGQDMVNELAHHPLRESAIKTEYPHEKISRFKEITNNDFSGKVALTHDREILVYLPIYAFVPWSAHYSHPAGLFHKRVDFLEKASRVNSPALFASALMNNRYSPIDYMFIPHREHYLHFIFADDAFPYGIKNRSISFPEHLFSGKYFTFHKENESAFITSLHENNPISLEKSSDGDMDNFSDEKQILLYLLISDYGDHIQVKNKTPLENKLRERIVNIDDATSLSVDLLYDMYLHEMNRGQDELFKKHIDSLFVSNIPGKMDIVLVDEENNPKLKVLGYSLNTDLPEENKVRIVIYFKVLGPLDRDYHLFLHGHVRNPEILPPEFREREFLSYDVLPAIPATQWKEGGIYNYTYFFETNKGEYNLSFGLWIPKDETRMYLEREKDFTVNMGWHFIE